MSAVVEQLAELESKTVPLPWPMTDFYAMPNDQFDLLFALSQSWPRLRDEIRHLEATVATLGRENRGMVAERGRMIQGVERSAAMLDAERRAHATTRDRLGAQLAESEAARAALVAIVGAIPARIEAAEVVCRSIDANKRGSGGAWGAYDGRALDAWKAAPK